MDIWNFSVIENTSDIKIIVEDYIYNLHKIILGASPYFLTIFNGNFLESRQETIELDFIDNTTWINILRYLYEKIKPLTNLYEIENDGLYLNRLSFMEIVELKNASDVLLLKELNEKCTDFEKNTISKLWRMENFSKLDNLSEYFDDDSYSFLIELIANVSTGYFTKFIEYFKSQPDLNLTKNNIFWENILKKRYDYYENVFNPLDQLEKLNIDEYNTNIYNPSTYESDDVSNNFNYLHGYKIKRSLSPDYVTTPDLNTPDLSTPDF